MTSTRSLLTGLRVPHAACGRHDAERITCDLTVENVHRWRMWTFVQSITKYTGHLGTAGRHAA